MIHTLRLVLSQLLGSRKVQTAVAAAAGAVSLQLLVRVHSELSEEAADLEDRVQARAAELAQHAAAIAEARGVAYQLRRQIERAYASGRLMGIIADPAAEQDSPQRDDADDEVPDLPVGA